MQYFYFSQGWEGLSAGTVVTVSGGTAIIGTDAFASAYDAVQAGIAAYGDYEETIYVDWELSSPDFFANTDWDGTGSGDSIYIDVANPADPSELYEGAIKLTYGTDAFSTITTARNAAKVGQYIQVVGGTFNDAHQGGSGSSARGWLSGRRLYVTDSTIQLDGTSSTSLALASNSDTNYDVEITVGKGGELLNAIFVGGAYAINRGNAVVNVINGGYVSSVQGGGIGANYATAADVDEYGKYIYDITFNVNGGSIGTITATSTGTTYADVHANLKNAYVSNFYLGNANTSTRLYGDAYISLDSSTITGTIKTGSSRSFNDLWFYGEVNVDVVGGTNSVGSLSIGTVKQMVEDVQVNVQPTVNITINGGAAVNFAAGSISASNVVNISINVEDYVASADKEQVLFLNGGGLQNANISIVGNNADKYTYSLENNNTKLFLNVKPTYFSVGWADLADGTVVEIPGGSATIGTDAFASYSAAAAAGAENIKSLDIFLNSDYNDTDPIVVSGYTATYGVDAFSTFADARTAYSASSKLGAIHLTGGTFSDGATTPAGTQYLAGATTVVTDGYAALLIGGNSSGDAQNTSITVKGGSVGTIYGANRANTALSGDVDILVEDGASVTTIFAVSGAGVSANSIVNVTLDGATANIVGAGSGVPAGAEFTYNIVSSTITNGIGGAGAANANVTSADITYNISNSTIGKLYADRGIDASGGLKNSAVTGAVTVNVFGGGTTQVTEFRIYGTCSSAAVNIAADSCLTIGSTNSIAGYTTFNIDVDGYTPTSMSKLVFSGRNLSTYSITVVGTGADKYTTQVDGTNLYLVLVPDAYVSAGWIGLEDGTVVDIAGGTAIIGTDAFATYAEATATGAEVVDVLDIYVNADWSELAPGAEVVVYGYTATIGTSAFADVADGATAYSATTGYGVLGLVGGTYSGTNSSSVGLTNAGSITVVAGTAATLTTTGAMTNSGAITIDVDSLSFTLDSHEYKVIDTNGSFTDSGSITLASAIYDVSKLDYKIVSGDLYVYHDIDGYISTRWTGLEDGTVVDIQGGTAVIGTDAFATYAEATAAGAELINVLDIYVNTDWSELTPGDTVVVGGYTATIGTNAFGALDSGKSAYASTAKYGALYLVGGTYTASTSMHTSGAAKQFADGYHTVIENSLISFLSAGWNANKATDAHLTIRGCTVTGGIGGGNRYYGSINGGEINVENSTVAWISPVSGPSTTDLTGTLTVNVTGSSVHNVFNQGKVETGEVVYNFTNSTFDNIAGAGSANASSANDVTFNLVSVTGGSFCATKGFDGGNWKSCYVLGDMAINVSGGTSTFTYLEINDNDGGSRTITIDADSALIITGYNSIVAKTDFVINVDGYTATDGNGKLVFSGKNLAAHNISIIGEDAADYHTYISGTNLYIAHNVDAYISIGWTGLANGTVVDVTGGTAVIGTDAFTGIDAATAAGKEFPSIGDVYYQFDWSGHTAGEVIDVATPGGTVQATIGTNAFDENALGAAKTAAANNYGVLHISGGSTSGSSSNRIALGGVDTYITNTTIETREVLGSTNTSQSAGYTNVTIGEGSTVTTYFTNRENFAGDATVTVRDGGYVANLYGGCTNASFLGGSTTINVFGSTVGAVGGGGVGSIADTDITMNFVDAVITGSVTGHSNIQSSANSGSLTVNATNTTIGGNFTAKGTGSSDYSGGIALNFNNVTVNQFTIANASAYGDVTLNLTDSSFYNFEGASADTGDYVINFNGSSINQSFYAFSNQGDNLTAASVDIDVVGTTVSRYFYGAYSATVNDDYTFDVTDSTLTLGSVVLNSGTVNGDLLVSYDNVVNGGNLQIVAGGAVTGNVVVALTDVSVGNRVDFTGGSATIGGTYTAVISGTSSFGAGINASQVDSFTVAADSSFTVGSSSINIGGTFANYGDLVFASESALVAFNTYGIKDLANNTIANEGTATITGAENLATAIDGDNTLFAYSTAQSTVYVNSAYASAANYERVIIDGVERRVGINAFASMDDVTNTGASTQIVAKSAVTDEVYGVEGTIAGGNFTKNVYGGEDVVSAGTVVDDSLVSVSGGTFRGLVGGQRLEADVTVSGDSAIEISGGQVKAAFGGHYVASGDATVSGDTGAAISGGTFSSFVTGGNVVATGASAYLTGTSTLSITGGYFGNAVAGGSDSQGGDIDSDTNYVSRVEISGGTFANGVYGGNVASKAAYANFSGNTHSTLIDINGSTEIAVDVTGTNAVNFGASNVVAGSYGQGQVSGTSTVTFTGSAANLTFTGILTGDSQNGGTNSRMVMGNRSLVFDDFDGAFNAKINGFDTVSFANDSAMSFTSANVYLQNVSTWNFSNGSSLAWSTGRNDFSGDTLNLNFTSLDSDWTILSGSETTLAGFDDFALVNINGVAADYDLVNNVYTAGDYQLYLDNNAMKLGTIA